MKILGGVGLARRTGRDRGVDREEEQMMRVCGRSMWVRGSRICSLSSRPSPKMVFEFRAKLGETRKPRLRGRHSGDTGMHAVSYRQKQSQIMPSDFENQWTWTIRHVGEDRDSHTRSPSSG